MKHASPSTAYLKGYQAHQERKSFDECPYAIGTPERTDWQNGYLESAADTEYEDD